MIGRSALVVAVAIVGLSPATNRAAESFDSVPTGPFAVLESAVGTWTTSDGGAEVHTGRARAGRPHDGNQALRILGGEDRTVDLLLPGPLAADSLLVLRAERWTRDEPFAFTIEAAGPAGPFRDIHDCGDVAAGPVPTPVVAAVPAGTARVRFRATTPPERGVLIDDVQVVLAGAMRLAGIDAVQPVVPVLVGKAINPVLGLRVCTAGNREPLVLEEVTVSLAGTTRIADIAEVTVLRGGHDPSGPFGVPLAAAAHGRGLEPLTIRDAVPLVPGDDWFWVSVRLADSADIDGRVDAAVTRVRISGRDVAVGAGDPPGAQRIGIVVRSRGADGCDTWRIPGLVRTNAGTLVAAYDARHRGAPDLPADIDVGTSRSTDGGRSWEPMRIALDMGRDPAFAFDGVGDPCVFVDRGTGRIHVAAVWSHGKRA